MSVAMKLLGIEGHSTGHDDRYLKEFDPSHSHPDRPESQQEDGACWLVTTPNIAEAMHFTSIIEGWECWKQVDARMPVRPDGSPNRPLTVFSITFDTVPEPTVAEQQAETIIRAGMPNE